MTLTFVVYGILSSLDFTSFKAQKFDRIFIIAASVVSIAMINVSLQETGNAETKPTTIRENIYTLDRLAPKPYYFKNPEDGPVVIIEYADFMCPGCRASFPQHSEMIKTYKGKLKFAYRSYPLMNKEGHEMSLPAAILAEIAAEKGLYWEVIEAFFGPNIENAKSVEELASVIAPLGLDPKELVRRAKDENDPAVRRVSDGLADASAAGVTGTPTYILFLPGQTGIVIPQESLSEVMTSPEVTAALGVKL